jgi:hypothetical protein
MGHGRGSGRFARRSRIESRKKNFRLTDVRIVADADRLPLRSNTIRRIWQPVTPFLSFGSISSTPTFHGYIRVLNSGTVSIPLKNLDVHVFADTL